jgi:hypothetical protein
MLTTHQEEFSVLIPAQMKSLNETQPCWPWPIDAGS